MILFFLCTLAVRAMDRDKKFFGGDLDDEEYCMNCFDEILKKEMTYCIHHGKDHYLWCRFCASDEHIQVNLEKTCRGELKMEGKVSYLMITCPICQESGKYNDDILKKNNDANIEMSQNMNDSRENDQMYQQQDNSIDLQNEEYDQVERAKRESLAVFGKFQNKKQQEEDEWNDEWEKTLEASRLQHEEELAMRRHHEKYNKIIDIRDYSNSPNKFHDHQRQNNLNSPRSSINGSLLVKNVIRERDRSTAHVMMTSTYMAVLFTLWIACMSGSHIDHTVDKMGYLMQMFSRTYFGFIGVSSFFYTILSRENAWTNKLSLTDIISVNCGQRDADANISLLMYLASFVSTILVGAGAFTDNVTLIQFTSWFGLFLGNLHFFGLFIQKCFQCSSSRQRRSCAVVLNEKLFKSLQKQPQESIRQYFGMSRDRWRTVPVVGVKGNLTGFFSSFIPFFGLLQAFFFFVHKSEITGEQFSENSPLAGIGLALGLLFTPMFQIIRWNADIGVMTVEQVLTGLIAWFMADHSDPQTSIVAIIFQMVFLGFYVWYKFCARKCL